MRALAILLLLSTTGCFSITYKRELVHEPISADAVATLEVGQSDLGQVLDRLGTPIYVWEGRGGDTLVAYGAQRERKLGMKFSIPLGKANASLSINNEAERLNGYVLIFDHDLKLKLVRSGLLRNLGVISRRRPSSQVEPSP